MAQIVCALPARLRHAGSHLRPRRPPSAAGAPAWHFRTAQGRPTYRQNYEALLKKTGKPFWPDAAWRDVVFSVLMTGVVVLLAIVYGPPELGKPPDPSIIAADSRPGW